MIRLRLAAACCAATLALGCTKHGGPASPDFQKARQDYLNLLAKDGPADVYTDPALPPIRAQLDKVPADSVDSDAAKALASTIDKGIADAKAAAAEHEKAVAESTKPPEVNVQPPAAPVPSEPAPAAPTAPQPAAPPPGPTEGMSAADFRTRFGGCFDKDSVYKDNQGNSGDAYVLNAGCATKYPSFKDEMVLLSSDKVVGIVPRSAAQNQQSFQVQSSKQAEQPAPPPPQQPPPVYGEKPAPPPPNPNTVDQGVKAPDSQVAAPSNLNSDLDSRTKMPGQQ